MKQIKLLAYRGVKASAADERPLVVLFARADTRGGKTIKEWFQYGRVASTREQIRLFRELARRLDMDEIHVRLRDEDLDGFNFPHDTLVTIQYKKDSPDGIEWSFRRAVPGDPGHYNLYDIDDFKLKEA